MGAFSKLIIIDIFLCAKFFSLIRHKPFLVSRKVIMQGKLFQRCMHLLYWSVLSLGGNVNTRRMSQPDMGSIVHIKNQWNILVKIQCSRVVNKHWCIYSCLQIPPRENWFQYVRRVYATAINFPCIITLVSRELLYTIWAWSVQPFLYIQKKSVHRIYLNI